MSTEENIISFKSKLKEKGIALLQEEENLDTLFEDTIKKNMEVRERLKKDRKRANKSVIRSYRLKK